MIPPRAIVIGATGGIGQALADALSARAEPVLRLARTSAPPLDLLDEGSIQRSAEQAGRDLSLVIDATGFLHGDGFTPERSLSQIDPTHLAHSFALNAIGPALLMKHFLPRLARDRRAIFATLSARVGSIADNRLGGWYSYRASKAALNQLVRTAAIQLARTHPLAIVVALHPGTVDTKLSAPFTKSGLDIRSAKAAAADLLAVLDALSPTHTGTLLDHSGATIPF